MAIDKKNLVINVAIVFVTIIIALFVIEFTLSMLNLEGDSFWMQDDRTGNIHIPNKVGRWVSPIYNNEVKINSVGFRDTEHSLEKSQDTYRIIVLGDSYIEALQVPAEKSMPALLEKKLNLMNSSKKYEVLNFGVSGWGTSNEYMALKNIGMNYHPDLVIVAFLTGNDVRDNSIELTKLSPGSGMNRPFYNLTSTGELIMVNPEWNMAPIPIVSNKMSFNYVNYAKNIVSQIFPKTGVFISKKLTTISSSIVTAGQSNKNTPQIKALNIDYYVYCGNYSGDYRNAWNTTEALIVKTNNVATSGNATLLLVSLTNHAQLYNSESMEQRYNRDYPECAPWDAERPERELTEIAQKHNITYLPLLPSFRTYLKNNPNTTFHNSNDGHWTEIGHELAADVIYDYITTDYTITQSK